MSRDRPEGGGREGFMSRWSRLKREPEKPEAVETAPQADPVPDGKALEDLIAGLPKIEDFVPGQNISVFMQAWVPSDIKHAALRRMWLLDPAIRDYVSPALDYAYDYNTPGMAPGFGPMETSTDAIREVAEMFDRALGSGSEAGVSGPAQQVQDNMSQSAGTDGASPVAHAAPQQNAEPVGDPASQLGKANPQALVDQSTTAVASANRDAAPQDKKLSDLNDLRPRGRRHGGALPG
jgi:hypothetical protein